MGSGEFFFKEIFDKKKIVVAQSELASQWMKLGDLIMSSLFTSSCDYGVCMKSKMQTENF